MSPPWRSFTPVNGDRWSRSLFLSSKETEVAKNLEKDIRFLDEAYPEIYVELVVIDGTFDITDLFPHKSNAFIEK